MIRYFSELLDQNLTKFSQHYESLYAIMSKIKRTICFNQGVVFEMKQKLPNKRTKYLHNTDDSCKKISSSDNFVKIATTGRHKKLSTVYSTETSYK